MGIRVSINIGQFPVGPEQTSTGQFVGSGPTPLAALLQAADSADKQLYRKDDPMNTKRRVALALLSYLCGDGSEEDDVVFAGEDHYNCALHIHERHKGVTR